MNTQTADYADSADNADMVLSQWDKNRRSVVVSLRSFASLRLNRKCYEPQRNKGRKEFL